MHERKIVAIVNNDLDMRYLARVRLKEAGYGVRLYDNTEDALQLIDNPANIAVLDCHNPPLGGLELFRRLRSAHSMPVIFTSGSIELVEKAFQENPTQPELCVCVLELPNLARHVRDLIGPANPPEF